VVKNIEGMRDKNNKIIRKLAGANIDVDLASSAKSIHWKQSACPWNEDEGTDKHRCAVKSTSICPYFCGIEYLDNVLCSYGGAACHSKIDR
jgi:hypothetical protein